MYYSVVVVVVVLTFNLIIKDNEYLPLFVITLFEHFPASVSLHRVFLRHPPYRQ